MTDPERVAHPHRIVAKLPPGFGVIYRHFGSKGRFVIGKRLACICKRRRLVLLVSADPELAIHIGADGVHWPETVLQRVRPSHPRWIETASAHSHAAIARASRHAIDAVLFSALFVSTSVSAGKPTGALRFRALAQQAPVPIYGLGGITHTNAASAMTYAAGWAAIDGVLAGWET